MLQRKDDGAPEPVLTTGWWMLTAEFDPSATTPEELSRKLADSLSFVEGTGFIDVVYQGTIMAEEGTI